MTGPRIYILAPVHNRRAVTEKFIRNLLAQSYANWHLLLIDDGSADGTEAAARTLLPESSLTVLTGKGNWWWAGSLHQGYLWIKQHQIASGDLVLTMNDDTEFDPDFLAIGVAAMQPHSLLLARCLDMEGRLDEVGAHWDWRKLGAHGVTDPAEVNCFATRGLFLHAGDFMDLDGFHPVLLPHYLSDYEFTMRAHRRGYRLLTVPELFLRFDESPALTGMRTFIDGLSPWQEMRRSLSMRSTSNPFSWSGMVILASPVPYIPYNLLRVWWRFLFPLRRHWGRTFFAPTRRKFAPVRHFLGRVKRKVQREWAARNAAKE